MYHSRLKYVVHIVLVYPFYATIHLYSSTFLRPVFPVIVFFIPLQKSQNILFAIVQSQKISLLTQSGMRT